MDELAQRAPRLPRLRAERRARHNSFSSGTRVGPSELYGYDAHRNVTFLTDAAGNLTDTYTFDAWGNLIGRTGSTANTRLYAGEEFDPDLGLINLRARQYSATAGRFFTVDPIDLMTSSTARTGKQANAGLARLSQPLNWNGYLYSNSDPINNVDPYGSEAEEEAGLAEFGNFLLKSIALQIDLVTVAIHAHELVSGEAKTDAAIGGMVCVGSLDATGLLLMVLNPDVPGIVDLALSGVSFACTLEAIDEENQGGGE